MFRCETRMTKNVKSSEDIQHWVLGIEEMYD